MHFPFMRTSTSNVHRIVFFVLLAIISCATKTVAYPQKTDSIPWFKKQPKAPILGQESKYFSTIYEITHKGDNAEAYFSWNDRYLVYQTTEDPYKCDQIFMIDLYTGERKLVSTGTGRTTCAFFLRDDSGIIFASTHEKSPECPPKPDYSRGYVWPLYDYDLYIRDLKTWKLKPFYTNKRYQAEATVGPQGTIVFTSLHEDDVDIYTIHPDGTGLQRITALAGYDGGPFFSNKNEDWIVFRASRPLGKYLEDYLSLLKIDMIRPSLLEIFVASRDGNTTIQLTHNGGANFAPYFSPNDKFVLYSSNMKNPRSRNFDLFFVPARGGKSIQITYFDGFDSFPMFSHDCSYLVFASNRTERRKGQTNIYIAELTEYAKKLWCSEN